MFLHLKHCLFLPLLKSTEIQANYRVDLRKYCFNSTVITLNHPVHSRNALLTFSSSSSMTATMTCRSSFVATEEVPVLAARSKPLTCNGIQDAKNKRKEYLSNKAQSRKNSELQTLFIRN